MKRSYFGALRVKDGPTNVTFVTIRFHSFSAQVGTQIRKHAKIKTERSAVMSRWPL